MVKNAEKFSDERFSEGIPSGETESARAFVLSLGDQGHAEDLLSRFRFCYYVQGFQLVSDEYYDAFEAAIRARWSVSGASHGVGSCRASDYPGYVCEGRRPAADERVKRDAQIVVLWMENL